MDKLMSDHGSQFNTPVWIRRVESEGIQVVFSSIRHLQSNIMERVNKQIGHYMLTQTSHNHKNWASFMSRIELCLNEILHEVTEFTPKILHFDIVPVRPWVKITPGGRINKLSHKKKLKLVEERMSKPVKRARRNTVLVAS